MVLSDLLKKLGIRIDLSKLKSIAILSGNKFENKVINNNLIVQVDNKIFNTDLETTNLIKQIFQTGFNDNIPLLDSKTFEKLEDIKKIDRQKENQDLLKYFSGKIISSDIPILRASIYLRAVYERGENVDNLKREIINIYGIRGKNIANLFSAGYFENLIKPLFEYMQAEKEFSLEKFRERYETIVIRYPFAIFVNRSMEDSELEKEVLQKINENLIAGSHELNIHGIGQSNVETIQKVYFKLKPKLIDSKMDSTHKYITLTIYF